MQKNINPRGNNFCLSFLGGISAFNYSIDRSSKICKKKCVSLNNKISLLATIHQMQLAPLVLLLLQRQSPLTLFKNPFFFSPSEAEEASVVDCSRFITLMSPFSLAGIKSTNFPVVGIKDLDLWGRFTRGTTVAIRVLVVGTNAIRDAGLNNNTSRNASSP